MARCARLAGATGLLLGAGVVAVGFAAPGFASTDTAGAGGAGSSFATEVSASSWYWSGTSPQANGTTLPASAPTEASNVPAGDRGVAFTNQVDKVTALAFATRALPAGATFSTFAVRLGLDPAVHQLADGVPALVACEAAAPVPANVEGGALSAAPALNLLACVPGVLDPATQTYAFELKALATRWAAGSPAYGIVVRPQPGSATPFTYAFLPDRTYRVASRYAPGPVAPKPVAAAPSSAPPAVVAPAVALPPTVTFPSVLSLPPLPVTPVALPVLAADPVVAAAPSLPTVAILPVRRVVVGESLRPTTGFWLAGLGLAALLVAAAVVVGDPLVPVAPDARRRRFAQVVRARAAAGTSPVPAAAGYRPTARRPRPV